MRVMPKVSWLDSTGQESNRHIAVEGETRTLCGYAFLSCFQQGVWTPYRTGRTKGDCPHCIKLAKEQNVSTKIWHSTVPERDIQTLPISSKRKQDITRYWRAYYKKRP